MYCVFILLASFFVCQVKLDSIERIIFDYFESESLRKFRKEWEIHRKPLEHAISKTLKESIGFTGMNMYIRKRKDSLAAGYFHNDNQVRLILKDLNLEELPRCWLPEVQFSLASNVLKIQTTLTKIIIHTNYALVRNKSDIIHDPKDQDPFQSSPFLFEQVQDVGRLAITLDDCMLSGFIITTLNGESINLGYHHLRLLNCQYTFEIYRPGEDSPPVIAKYNPSRNEGGLDITHLLMTPISDEFVPKLQAAMFSFINVSAIFGEDLKDYRNEQDEVFLATWHYLTEIVWNLNRITIKENNGAIEMEDYDLHWYDGRVALGSNQTSESLKLMNMVLTGLDTVYSAHSGGPYKINIHMIGEEIRFSSLQVRGYLDVKSTWSNKFEFAVKISDMVVDLQLDASPGQVQWERNNAKAQSKKRGYKTLEVTGFRRMVLTAPTLIFGSVESLISGHILNEVPKLIKSHLKSTLPEALNSPGPSSTVQTPPLDLMDEPTDFATSQDEGNEEAYGERQAETSFEKLGGKQGRDIFQKAKKRFKSASQPLSQGQRSDFVDEDFATSQDEGNEEAYDERQAASSFEKHGEKHGRDIFQ